VPKQDVVSASISLGMSSASLDALLAGASRGARVLSGTRQGKNFKKTIPNLGSRSVFLSPQKMGIWVSKVNRIAVLRVWMSVIEQMCPGHGSSGAVSQPGAAAR